MKAQTLDQISKSTIDLLLEEPFFGHFFAGMLKQVSTDIDTLTIGFTPEFLLVLKINPGFWAVQSKEKRIGLLKHEILHIALKHLIRIREFDHRVLFNIAADLVVNQYLSSAQLPENALTLSTFKALQPEPDRPVDYYYRKLLAYWTAIRNESVTDVAGLLKLLLEKDENLKKHAGWEQIEDSFSIPEIKIINRTVDANLRNAIDRTGWQQVGQLPGVLQMALKKLNVAKPLLNWRSALRLFVSSSGGNRLKNTIHRPSRRYGISPGIKIGRNKKLLVAIDTSGSVNQKRLNLFFREVHHLWKLGHEISVLECDAAIQRKYFYRGRLPEMVWGRGGTLYEAPIQLANEQIQPDGLLYFTDGYGPVPKLKSRMPLLWIIASQRMEEGPWDSLPGRKIFID